MTSRNIRRLFGFLILLLSLALLLWSFWPLEHAVRSLPILPEDMQLPDLSGILFMPGFLLWRLTLMFLQKSYSGLQNSGFTRLRKSLFGVSLVLLLALLLPACAAIEPGNGEEEAEPEPGAETLPTLVPSQPPAIPEQRLLSLEWPAIIRQGDSDLVIMTLQMDEEGRITPTAKFSGHETTGERVEIPNLYETHNVMAEARLDMAGVVVTPDDITSITLLPGKTVTFTWSVQPDQPNTYRGAIWFYLRFIPKDGSPDYQHLVSTQPVEIRCVNFLGLSGTLARLLGGAGALFGSVLSIDTIAGWGWNLYKKKLSRAHLLEKE